MTSDMSGPFSDKPDGTTAKAQVAIMAVALQLICCDPYLHIASLMGTPGSGFIETSLYAVANSDHRVGCNRTAQSAALYDSAKPHFQSGVATASANLKRLSWDIKI